MDKIKMVLCDLDGTLLTSQGRVSDATIAKIKEIKAQGILFGLATGRDVDVCEPLYSTWGIDGLVDIMMGINGAHIVDYVKDEEHFFDYTDGKEFFKVLEHFKDMPVNFAISHEGILKVAFDDDFNEEFEIIEQTPVKVVDYQELLKIEHPKIHVIFKQEYLDLVSKRAQEFSDEKLVAVNTGSIMWEVFSKNISKANGLKHLAHTHEIRVSDIMVFGDGDNDLEMIEAAGVGVAMANGSKKVLAAANYITDSNDEEGIANFLDKFEF
ncbi:MAG: HAD family hydrolase [Erysipelotrichaceae bacterium]|nr:HAD family hydrolase [Erysipelotrichaceae bacterium]